MTLDVVAEDPRWAELGLGKLAEQASNAVCEHFAMASNGWGIVLMGCNDARIADLNTEFRGKPVPTNVLSWPSVERSTNEPGVAPAIPDRGEDLGDIAIAYETTEKEAREAGISMGDHACHLLVHAILHLLGYDHVNDADGDLMEATEIAILERLGIPNPY